ncbi:acylneuraminate cytidylyltransferase family protein [Formosa sp. PL04]|uniref:acylneuraminate cytidylyltransferase family protein n=1 Tax=Formosa sp. PL04 TaxID=3081755 RepID=UPI0029825517|nr:acylneuraminate cytidylyltransferase family protein [Formosa sp. PL04]MDW5288998.1 acylneuraminate cytidylyltransferase family protein [Formosa sp. PL04]
MITAFLPCRAGSERVPEKNTKLFSGIKGGLLAVKLNQLLQTPLINRIVVSTNDQEVIDIAKNIDSNIIIDRRPEHLATSATSTDELINYVPDIIKEGHVLWTHVTSPFLTNDVYEKAILKYLEEIEIGTFDSLMTVNKIQSFLWNDKGSVNYDREVEKWPRTQTISELYEINSGIFLNSVDNYNKYGDRIGQNPFMFKSEGYASFDIDWPHDFKLGEMIYKTLNGL